MARILIGVVAVLLVAHVVTVTIVGDGEPGWLARRFDMNGEYGFPAGFSALLLGTWGILGLQGDFLPIRTTEVLGKQTIDNLEPGPDFVLFNSREIR